VTVPICFTTADGKEVTINGLVSWSDQYFSITVDGVPTCRPRALIEALVHPTEGDTKMPSTKNKTVDQNVVEGQIVGTEAQLKAQDENHELSVDEDVHENSAEENAAAVAKATAKSSPAPEKDSTPKAPSTVEVGAAWIRAHVDGTKTKDELLKLAAKQNPTKHPHPTKPDIKVPYSTKDIVRLNKIGRLLPGNAQGFYWNESTDSHKGGVEILIDSETGIVTIK